MAVGWEVVRCDRSLPPPFDCFPLFIYYKNFDILLNFFNETTTLLLKQLEANFKYQRIFQCHKRKWKLQILWILCENIAWRMSWSSEKNYSFGEILSANCMKQISSNHRFCYYKRILSSTTSMISLMLSFMSAKH